MMESEVSAQGELFALLARVYFYRSVLLYGMCLSTLLHDHPHTMVNALCSGVR